MRAQKVDDGRVVPIMTAAVDVNCLPGISWKAIFEVECDYQRYRGILHDDAS